MTSTLIGATKPEQLETNLGALELEIPAELRARLDAVSRPEVVHPYVYFAEPFVGMISGGVTVRGFSA